MQLFGDDNRAAIPGFLHRISGEPIDNNGSFGMLTYRMGRPMFGRANALADITAGLAKGALMDSEMVEGSGIEPGEAVCGVRYWGVRGWVNCDRMVWSVIWCEA